MYFPCLSVWVKDYILWCIELGFQKLTINRDVFFHEKAMPHLRKESITIDKDHGIHKQEALDVRPSIDQSHGYTLIQSI